MPEGVHPYPRWQGALKETGAWRTVAAHDLRVALRQTWPTLALVGGLAWGLFHVAQVIQFRREDMAHELEWYLDLLRQLRWAAVALAAAMGAPLILQDAQRGALELYLTRGVAKGQYLFGKAAAVLAATFGVMALPAVAYYVAMLVVYDQQPDGWHADFAWGLLYALMWSLLCVGVALGASCATRTVPGATLIVLGAFVGLHLIVAGLISSLSANDLVAVASPFVALDATSQWWWPIERAVPALWGLLAWLALTVLGWTLVAWRHPRVRGEERA